MDALGNQKPGCYRERAFVTLSFTTFSVSDVSSPEGHSQVTTAIYRRSRNQFSAFSYEKVTYVSTFTRSKTSRGRSSSSPHCFFRKGNAAEGVQCLQPKPDRSKRIFRGSRQTRQKLCTWQLSPTLSRRPQSTEARAESSASSALKVLLQN